MATQSTQFGWITYLQARQQLALRLDDVTNNFWTDIENGLYIQEALSVFNCLTQYWEQDWELLSSPGGGWGTGGWGTGGWGGGSVTDWISTSASGSGSPREQTLTDFNVYQYMTYHLLETPIFSSGQWSGTSQFTINDLVQAVQGKRDEVLQISACNMAFLNPSIPPATNQIYFPDNTLDVRRVRYLPALPGYVAATLIRGDGLTFQRFSYNYRQTSGQPMRWDVLSGPPLTLNFDTLIDQPNSTEILVMQSGNTLNPQAGRQSLQVPNDWMWVVKFGALSDVLGKESESTDRQRAEYCNRRYQEGLKLMAQMPWLMQAFVNNQPVETTAVTAKDRWDYEWQANANAFPAAVIGGIDLVSICPIPQVQTGITLKLVGNAPQPLADGDLVQVPRDALDVVLDYAQHIAAFKMGGAEFADTMPLYEGLVNYCMQTNQRLRESGIFATDLRPPVSKEDLAEPRYAVSGGG